MFKIFNFYYRLIFESVDDKNPWDEKGWTPLHHAAEMGNLEVCKFILENVSDKNPTNDYNETPVDMAREHGRIDSIFFKKLKYINTSMFLSHVYWSLIVIICWIFIRYIFQNEFADFQITHFNIMVKWSPTYFVPRIILD